MDTTSPGFARGRFAPRTAVAARANRRTEHKCTGRERSAAPSAWASAGGAAEWEASMKVPAVFAALGCSERVQFLP